ESSELKLETFKSGLRYNMVPDFAEAHIEGEGDFEQIAQEFRSFLEVFEVVGRALHDENTLKLELEGVSAHGMEPNNGKNAGLLLATFLQRLDLDEQALGFLRFTSTYFIGDSRGEELGVAYSDDITGDLTINVGKITYTSENGGRLGLNLRYPVTNDMSETKNRIE